MAKDRDEHVSTEPSAGTYHLLIVEDEPDHLLAVQMTFSLEKDFVLHSASSAEEAEEVLNSTPIDVVLLELALPGEDGMSFCERIKADEKFENLPFIAFSAYPHHFYEERARAAGCSGFIDKPFEARELVARVRKLASRRS